MLISYTIPWPVTSEPWEVGPGPGWVSGLFWSTSRWFSLQPRLRTNVLGGQREVFFFFFDKVTRKSCLEENVFELGLGLKSERPKILHFYTVGAKTRATQCWRLLSLSLCVHFVHNDPGRFPPLISHTELARQFRKGSVLLERHAHKLSRPDSGGSDSTNASPIYRNQLGSCGHHKCCPPWSGQESAPAPNLTEEWEEGKSFWKKLSNVISPVALCHTSHLPVSAASSLSAGFTWAHTQHQGKSWGPLK